MTPEDKELCKNLSDFLGGVLGRKAIAAIERLSAEVESLKTTPAHLREDLRCAIQDLLQQVRDRDAELAALRAQIAEAQPVACLYPCGWQGLHKIIVESGAYLARSLVEDEPINEHQRNDVMRMIGYARDLCLFGMKLHANPAADAKDAERYRWLKPRLFGADWDWNNEGVSVILFKWPESASIDANLDESIDAAMKGGA